MGWGFSLRIFQAFQVQVELEKLAKHFSRRVWSSFSAGSEDEQQPLIPKTEEDLVSSPSSKIITDVLMSMNQGHQQDFAPSFDL
ncbi:hypothetical protein PIB30_091821 [Stylosanthes scabra]|uniref:Uncharacterized protein n=1 Tax=Stylosanthes scabra TaxID=79078 RepID=A0ABU6TU81_9FABA|nr:hypothetical protein [Stylosanthes scabra]